MGYQQNKGCTEGVSGGLPSDKILELFIVRHEMNMDVGKGPHALQMAHPSLWLTESSVRARPKPDLIPA